MVTRTYARVAWGLFAVVVAVPTLVWANKINWSPSNIALTNVFPLVGILAWSIMWTHYAYGAFILSQDSAARKDRTYRRFTQWLVLALILLHPGLLALNQWQVRNILPPEAFYGYVGQSLRIYVALGSVAFLAFLAFEVLVRLRRHRLINKYWFYVSISQAVAMVLIFVHALKIGQDMHGWFELYWIGLGCLLIPCFGIILRYDWQQHRQQRQK